MRYFTTILALLFVLSTQAQEIIPQSIAPRKDIKEQLASSVQIDSLTTIHENVQIVENGDAAKIIEGNLKGEAKMVNGYRIVIFMSNSQSARRDAVTAQENFSSLFPQEQSYLTYENPYFKVAVGNCTTQEEAIILLGRVRGSFPKAFIMRESIDIGEFTR